MSANDKDALVEAQTMGFELLVSQAAIIAELPLEDWDAAFERAEAVGPILDPTLYRQYLYSGKGDVIRKVIKAAIPLKHAVLEARKKVLSVEVQP